MQIVILGILKGSASRKQNVVVLVDVIKSTDVERRAILSVDLGRGLMKYLSTERQFFCDFPLHHPTEEPVVLVVAIAPVVEPVAAAPISRPGAETLLHP